MKKGAENLFKIIGVALFWIGIWYLLSLKVGEELLLPSPHSVLKRFFMLASEKELYEASVASLLRVITGVVAGLILGIAFAVLTSCLKFTEALLSPLFSVIKATPVASFIMLALLWIRKDNLPAFITFLIVFPVAWANIQTGLKSTPRELLEVSKVHKMSLLSKILHIYIPSLLPFLASTAKSALGLAWKAGIAAEVLAVPESAIGSEIYESKIFFETTELFAWTLLKILLSILMEFAIGALLTRLQKRYEYPTGGEALGN